MKNFNQLVNSQLTINIKNYDKLSAFVYELMHLNKDRHNLWVVVKQQQLTLLTDNPYLATQLRYQQQTICNELNRRFLLEIKTGKVKIVPPTTTSQTIKKDLYTIGEKASGILASIAEEIDDDELKQSLLKLAKRSD
jgi:hypothetical protein